MRLDREPGDDDDIDDDGVTTDDDGATLWPLGRMLDALRLGVMPTPPARGDTRDSAERYFDAQVTFWQEQRARWEAIENATGLRIALLRDEVRAARSMGVDASPQIEEGMRLAAWHDSAATCARLCIAAQQAWRHPFWRVDGEP